MNGTCTPLTACSRRISARGARRGSVLLLILLSAPLAGCFGPSTSDKDLRWLDAAAVTKMLGEKGTPTLLVDVRPPEQYARGHLPGAENVPLPKIDRNHPGPGRAARLILYDNSWRDPLAPAAAKKLIAAGRGSVFVFRGGVTRWRKLGRPLVGDKQVGDKQAEAQQHKPSDQADHDGGAAAGDDKRGF